MIPIESGKRIDWNAIKAEYLNGGISQEKLAKKYGISYPTLRDRAKREKWKEGVAVQREKVVSKTLEKTANAIATNAAKLEKAKGLAIDRLVDALEHFPANAGDTLRQYGKGKDGNRFTNQYSLLDIVSAIEKLEHNSTVNETDDPLTAILKRWDDASRRE